MPWTLDRSEKLTAFVGILLVALVFLRACPASGQETPSDPPPVPLEEGEPAPYAGDLWSVNRSLRLVFRAEQCQEKAALDLRHAARGFEIELDFDRKSAKVKRDADAERIGVLRTALENANPWYESPLFVAPLSVAGTLLLVLVTAVVLEAVASAFAQMASP